MNLSTRAQLAALVIVILAMSGAFGTYYANTSSILAGQGQTISGLQSAVSSLVSHTLTSTVSISTTVVSVSTTTFYTQGAAPTVYRLPGVPWNSSTLFLITDPTCEDSCVGPNLSKAVVFNCTSAAATPQGCTLEVISPAPFHPSYNVTVWYPYAGGNQPSNWPAWANCAASFPSIKVDHIPRYCIALGPNDFILAEQGP